MDSTSFILENIHIVLVTHSITDTPQRTNFQIKVQFPPTFLAVSTLFDVLVHELKEKTVVNNF